MGRDYMLMENLSERTQDVMYSRKIILDSLINDTKEEIFDLDTLIHHNTGNKVQIERMQSNAPIMNLTPSYISRKPIQFSPKWSDYDVMKHRWTYLKPQAKRLNRADTNQILPKS